MSKKIIPNILTSRWLAMSSPSKNQTHIRRIMKDVQQLYNENPTDIHVIPQEDNLALVHALVIGPKDTPYENGFFYFVLKYDTSIYTSIALNSTIYETQYFRFPDDYPLKPPQVELKTTLKKTVRFNPNLYANGKVCLSILGTWTGKNLSFTPKVNFF